ncbi:hypothetical protein ACT3SP_14100 [Brachybacterium sp. AOP43-C2-M15]
MPACEAPARRTDLTSLPPTLPAVGDIELLTQENGRYARRLAAY